MKDIMKYEALKVGGGNISSDYNIVFIFVTFYLFEYYHAT